MPELQALRAEHAAAVLAFETTNRSYFAASISDRGDAYFEDFAARQQALLAEQEAGIGAYYVLVDDAGAVLGRFNLLIDGNGVARLGYRVAEEVAGRGVASATVRELCLLAVSRHGLTTLRAAISRENVASQRLLLNAGFVEVGPADPAEIGGKQGSWYERELELRSQGGPMASVKQVQVTFDCAHPERLARFWCDVLGYVVPPPPEGFASWGDFDRALPPERQGSAFACIDPTGVGPRLFFQRVPEGKVVKNRLHLDVRVGTGLVGEERVAALEAECARLVALGAVRVRLMPADDIDEATLVMQDVEGNEFCLD